MYKFYTEKQSEILIKVRRWLYLNIISMNNVSKCFLSRVQKCAYALLQFHRILRKLCRCGRCHNTIVVSLKTWTNREQCWTSTKIFLSEFIMAIILMCIVIGILCQVSIIAIIIAEFIMVYNLLKEPLNWRLQNAPNRLSCSIQNRHFFVRFFSSILDSLLKFDHQFLIGSTTYYFLSKHFPNFKKAEKWLYWY